MKRQATNFDLRTPLIARSTLSSTVRRGNRRVIWNVRAMPSVARRWLGQAVTSWPNSSTLPSLAGRIPVIRLNSVVLPAPFGPMIALRSPGMIFRSTPRTACRPPKLLHRPASSSTGCCPLWDCWSTRFSARLALRLLAVPARRKIAAIDRLLGGRGLVVLPELTDVRIGLDDRVPQLVLVVAEHPLLLDLADVDVLHRVAHLVEAHRPAHRVDLDALHQLDELFRARPLAAGLLHHLVDPLCRGVVALREVGRDPIVLGPVGLDERLVLRRLERGAVLQGRTAPDRFVAHRRQHERVVARAAADHRRPYAGRDELLGELRHHRPDHQREDRVRVRPDGRDIGPEILGGERRPELLDDLAAALLERLLETADHLVAERVVGGDHRDLVVALIACPLAERMARLRARPARAHEIRIFVELALGGVVRRQLDKY